MKRIISLVAFFIFPYCPTPALASGCWGAGNTLQILKCMEEQNKTTQVELLNNLTKLQKISAKLGDGMLEDLNKTQEKWLEYREYYCSFYADYLKGGTGYGPLVGACENTLDKNRTEELVDRLNWLMEKGHDAND